VEVTLAETWRSDDIFSGSSKLAREEKKRVVTHLQEEHSLQHADRPLPS
jgi:hypothetical protein